jgi:hypothetical protein
MRDVPKAMHATTVRFSEELWRMLEAEARASGVSVAQYVREAALTRVAYAAGRRGDPLYEAAAKTAGSFADAGDRHLAEAEAMRRASRALRAEGGQAARRARAILVAALGEEPDRAGSDAAPTQPRGRARS